MNRKWVGILNKFKIGDLVICNGSYRYGLTHENAICVVVDVFECGTGDDIEVVVRDYVDGYKPREKELRHYNEKTKWEVDSKYFDLYKPKKETNVNIL